MCYVSRTLRKLTCVGNKWFYSNLSMLKAAKKSCPFMPIIKKNHCCLACSQNTPVFCEDQKKIDFNKPRNLAGASYFIFKNWYLFV